MKKVLVAACSVRIRPYLSCHCTREKLYIHRILVNVHTVCRRSPKSDVHSSIDESLVRLIPPGCVLLLIATFPLSTVTNFRSNTEHVASAVTVLCEIVNKTIAKHKAVNLYRLTRAFTFTSTLTLSVFYFLRRAESILFYYYVQRWKFRRVALPISRRWCFLSPCTLISIFWWLFLCRKVCRTNLTVLPNIYMSKCYSMFYLFDVR